jgi:sugar phosphate isomerase/epimerase
MATPSAPGYSLFVFGTNWGFNGTTSELCAKLKQAGYDGLELWWPSVEKDRQELFQALEKNQLKVGFLVGSGETDFKKHQQQFQDNLAEAAKAKPIYINCHSGKDFFSFEQNTELIAYSNGLSFGSHVPIYHETHRGRALYAAPVTKKFMDFHKDLRITLDISHWCNVHESFLQGQEETVSQTLGRTDHIHARIGHPEGPQVSDPRAPEWADAVKHHFDWWDKVVETKKKEGKRITFLTEFGPPDYMPTLPYTRQAVADQWAINVYMMEVLRKRYSA